jgi:hypothetical protein
MVTPLNDFTFMRFPVTETGTVEEVGRLSGGPPDARVWRYIARAHERLSSLRDIRAEPEGPILEPPNLLVEFIVVGYRPDSLIEFFSRRAT